MLEYVEREMRWQKGKRRERERREGRGRCRGAKDKGRRTGCKV